MTETSPAPLAGRGIHFGNQIPDPGAAVPLPGAQQRLGSPAQLFSGTEQRLGSPVRESPPPVSSETRPPLWTAAARFRSLSGERPKQERDSLRNRSQEGRPGSRKNKRWIHDREITRTLRRAMAACGEDGDGDLEDLIETGGPVPMNRPSVFYRLLQHEGPEGALEAWASAEGARRGPRARSRPPAADVAARRAEDQVRRAFSDTWQYIHGSVPTRELLTKLEGGAARAFSEACRPSEEAWQLAWDGDSASLDTVAGEPPTGEMEVFGLTAQERKVAHQLARLLGLHSESRECDDFRGVSRGDGKALAWRPPRSRQRCHGAAADAAWAPPFSVAQVLVAAE